MASRRQRAQRSIGNKINNLDSRTNRVEKKASAPHLPEDAIEKGHLAAGSVPTEALEDHSVTEEKIAPGAVNTEHLGTITEIKSDTNLDLVVGGTVKINGVDLGTSSGGGGVPAGTILPFSGDTLPANALWAEGQAVSRVFYATLFNAIGTTYGTGDGSTTFNVPDMRGRVPVGLDPLQTEFDTLGEAGGAKTHAHGSSGLFAAIYAGYLKFRSATGWTATNSTNLTIPGGSSTGGTGGIAVEGSTDSGSSLQPYRVVRYIITTANADLPSDSALATRVGALEDVTYWQGENLPAFSAIGTSTHTQGGPQQFVLLWLGTVILNNGNHYNSVTGKFTAPVSGIYLVDFGITSASSVGGPEVFLYKNGTITALSAIAYVSYTKASMQARLALDAGDVLELQMRNNNGVTVVVDRTRSHFSASLIN